MSVFWEAARVLVLGAVLAAAVGLVRGLPEIATELPICTGGEEGGTTATVGWIAPDQAKELLSRPDVAFLDARPQDTFHRGHIAGSYHVPMDTGALPSDIDALLTGKQTIITYCDAARGCADGARLAHLLSAAGYQDVRVLEGGFPRWMERGMPAEAGECQRCPQ